MFLETDLWEIVLTGTDKLGCVIIRYFRVLSQLLILYLVQNFTLISFFNANVEMKFHYHFLIVPTRLNVAVNKKGFKGGG